MSLRIGWLALALACTTACTLAPRVSAAKDAHGTEVLTDDSFTAFITAHSPVLVEFYAPWCGHCKRLAPVMDFLAAALVKEGHLHALAKIDCIEAKKVAAAEGVTGFPTLKLYRDGKFYEKYTDARAAPPILAFLKDHISGAALVKKCGSDEGAKAAASLPHAKLRNEASPTGGASLLADVDAGGVAGTPSFVDLAKSIETSPVVLTVENMLSAVDAAHLAKLGHAQWAADHPTKRHDDTKDEDEDEEEEEDGRVLSCATTRGGAPSACQNDAVVARLQEKVAALSGVGDEYQEPLQIVRFRADKVSASGYGAGFDSGEIKSPWGPRVLGVMVLLEDSGSKGCLHFPFANPMSERAPCTASERSTACGVSVPAAKPGAGVAWTTTTASNAYCGAPNATYAVVSCGDEPAAVKEQFVWAAQTWVHLNPWTVTINLPLLPPIP